MADREGKTVAGMSKSFLGYLNKRPVLTFLIILTVILDIIWLEYANLFNSGLLTYFEYRPFEAGTIVALALILIGIFVKKVNR